MTNAELEQEKQQRLTAFQAIFDSALEPFGRHTPAPVMGEGINGYRRRGITAIVPFLPKSSDWYNFSPASLEGLKSDALNVIQRDVINDATYCARNPRLLDAAYQPGEPRALVAAWRRTTAPPHTGATGQLDGIEILIRRTLARTYAPILSSLRRIVPHVTFANGVWCRAIRRNAQSRT
jgi:hypothetical protein